MNPLHNDTDLLAQLTDSIRAIKQELHKTIIGQNLVIDDLLACFLAGGHCLIIGVPGLAKTTLVHSLALCLHLDFTRIQFTPDLMPSDITGSEILYEDKATGHREFRFVKGPLFGNIVLADEINRTPPKTQAALLQAMQENAVTSYGTTWQLPMPFWVLATQNPIEHEGTYPLPEAQQDRFMFSIEMNYPDLQTEIEIVRATTDKIGVLPSAVVSANQIMEYRNLVRRVPIADSVVTSAVRLARSTRPTDEDSPASIKELISWGAGPRASQCLVLAAKSYALLDGRATPDVDDIKRAAYPVLRHRVVRSFTAETENISSNEIIERILR